MKINHAGGLGKNWRKEKSMKRQFITAAEIGEVMGVSISTAYKVVKQLNAELASMGYLTVSGKVPRTFFEEKAYGVKVEAS